MGLFKKSKSPLPSGSSAEQLSSYDCPYESESEPPPQPHHPAHLLAPTASLDEHSSSSDAWHYDGQEHLEPKFKRNIFFGRHSARDLGRSLSVRHRPTSGPSSPVGRHDNNNNNNNYDHRDAVEASDQRQQSTQQQDPRSSRSLHPHPLPPPPSPYPLSIGIQRSNTDSSLDKPPNPYSHSHSHSHSHSRTALYPSTARRPSQQSLGPPSPFPHPHDNTMADRQKESPSYQRHERETSVEGRTTPTKRDDEVDVRALAQKHDELQAKYNRVKRYFFEKDAQVQHLQNTVAHQRMAVSRTVLDDNEYASRFGRLDGAIKDLAFSIRKDWKILPSWLHGYVNDDAHMVGTKEMTATGRAVISRWVVEEVFQRYFHPALDPQLSAHLKSIENNLRQQQQGKAYTDEDRENAIARISNWRRTTFDGLGDALTGKTADDNRSQLIENLIAKLVASLEMNLVSPPPIGIDTGARMIIENTVGIAEKIPLESRDICVDYFHPGSLLNENVMKIETSVPPLTNVKSDVRGSVDQERGPTDELEDSSSSNSQETGSSPAQGKEKKKSVFSSLMKKTASGRKDEDKDQAGAGQTQGQGQVQGQGQGQGQQGQIQQIRFAAFVAAEVRGKGPANVLVKAPVYVIE